MAKLTFAAPRPMSRLGSTPSFVAPITNDWSDFASAICQTARNA